MFRPTMSGPPLAARRVDAEGVRLLKAILLEIRRGDYGKFTETRHPVRRADRDPPLCIAKMAHYAFGSNAPYGLERSQSS